MKFIYYLSLAPLIVIAYFIAIKINSHFNKDIDEARETISEKDLKKLRKSYHEKIQSELRNNNKIRSHFDRVEARLKKMGNPYKLTALTYYAVKIIPSTILLSYMIINNKFNVLILILNFLLFFYIDIRYYLMNKDDEAQIRRDLPKIYNLLEIQTFADIPFDQAILEIHDVVKNKRLRDAFIDMSAEIITRKNIPNALKNFKAKFKSPEIYSFVLTIEQGIETGKIREMLSNQRKVLYKSYLNSKDVETSNNQFKVTISMLLLFLSIGSLTLFSFLYKIIDGLDFIIK